MLQRAKENTANQKSGKLVYSAVQQAVFSLSRHYLRAVLILHYSDWVCTAVMSNDVMKDLRG